MIRYLYAHELRNFPRLADTMFRDRASQFRDRHGWDVTVDAAGHERDAYDEKGPLYVIWETRDGCHGGSLRFLPTMGATMVNDHFLHLLDGTHIASPFVWECTRFCLSPGAPGNVAAGLMLGGLEVGLGHGLSHAIGVFDARMLRVYRALGWSPALAGERDGIGAGFWAFDAAVKPGLLRKTGISAELSRHWYRRAFGAPLLRTG